MTTFTFLVGFAASKDALMAGEITSGVSHVTVVADGPVEARLVAEQLVAARGVEPTEVVELTGTP